MSPKKVAVAMSGGVDSSMAASLLKEAGYEVVGVHMLLTPDHSPEHSISDLENTCQLLGIPLYKLNFESEYQKDVIKYFCKEYSLGRTPNPCVACNQHIKFGLLLDRVIQMGADYLATGHYARSEPSPDGYRLLKGVDPAKDQSYFLYTLGQRELPHLILPLGNLHKMETQKLARESGLPASGKPESQDVCFIRDKDYRAFLARNITARPGDVIDTEGNILARHSGLANYTVGQRQGLGLSSNERRYVLRLDAATNQVTVGSREQLLQSSLTAGKLSWVSGKPPADLSHIMAKIRYGAPEVAVRLSLNGKTATVEFQKPQSAITPGQSIVFYQGDAVLGGGIIAENVY